MTDVRYNDVEFSFVRSRGVESVPEYDQHGVDHLYTRHTVTIEATLVAGDPDGPVEVGEFPAETEARIRHRLEVPRRAFLYTVDDRTVFDVVPAGEGNPEQQQDATTGPTPKVHSIDRIAGDTFRVTFSVSFCLRGCPDVKQTFASNRWVQTQSLDERQYSTIHTAGRLVCTADMLRGLKSIDDLRWVVTPPVPNDFTRTSARYTVQADGLALDYDFMDEERYLSPPAGATRLRGTYTRSTNNFGARYLCEVSIRLEGKKGEPKRRLMATAIAVALDKLVRARPLVGGQVMIRDGMFRETLDENVVEVVLRAMAADTAQAPNSKVVQAVGELGGRLAVQGAVGAAGPLAQAAQAVANVLAQQREKPAGANPAADAAAGKLSPVVGLDLSQFDGRLLGCSTPPQLDGTFKPGAGIAPELFGNLPKLRMIAAALNDPCLAQTSANQERVSPGDRPAGEFLAMTTAERLAYQPAPPQTRHAAPVVELTPKLPPRMLSSAAQNYDSPGVWEEFSCLMLNAYDSVRHVLPATSEGVPGKVCRTHNPTCDLVVTWTARKWGGKPTVPSWADSADGNLICTRHFVGTEEPELGPDGETIGWTISGEYRYSYLDATVATVRDPIPPWLPVSASQADKYPTTGTVIHGAQSSTLRSR